MNQFAAESQNSLQMRYRAMKQVKNAQKSSFINIRMTNAQMHADNAVRGKIAQPEQRAQFKLKRFQEVEPRTSTKRGDQGYMVQVRK